MEAYNQQTSKQQQQQQQRSLLLLQRKKQRNNHQRKIQQRQSLSIIAIVMVSLCQAPSGSHALVHSRGNAHQSFGVVFSNLNVPSSFSTISMKDTSTPSSSTILHYRNYRVTDGGYNQNNKSTFKRTSSGPKAQEFKNSNDPSEDQALQPELHKHHGDHHISSFIHTLWTSGKTKRAKELWQKQVVLDDYLESIDRRYKRLHEEKNRYSSKNLSSSSSSSSPSSSPSSSGTKGGFTSALQWLIQTQPESTSEAEEMRKQDDAIYVLGLADLASTRLLQKHQLPIPKSKKSVVIDIDFVEPIQAKSSSVATSRSSQSTETISTDGTVARSKAVLVLQLLHNLKLASMKKNALTILKTLGKGLTQGLGSLVSFVGATSGFKSSLQMLSVAFVSVLAFTLSLIRPMTRA